jgi:AraC-like DNA-binding protein
MRPTQGNARTGGSRSGVEGIAHHTADSIRPGYVARMGRAVWIAGYRLEEARQSAAERGQRVREFAANLGLAVLRQISGGGA